MLCICNGNDDDDDDDSDSGDDIDNDNDDVKDRDGDDDCTDKASGIDGGTEGGGDATELIGDRLDVDEPNGDGNNVKVTIPAFAAAVSIMSYAGL